MVGKTILLRKFCNEGHVSLWEMFLWTCLDIFMRCFCLHRCINVKSYVNSFSCDSAFCHEAEVWLIYSLLFCNGASWKEWDAIVIGIWEWIKGDREKVRCWKRIVDKNIMGKKLSYKRFQWPFYISRIISHRRCDYRVLEYQQSRSLRFALFSE